MYFQESQSLTPRLLRQTIDLFFHCFVVGNGSRKCGGPMYSAAHSALEKLIPSRLCDDQTTNINALLIFCTSYVDPFYDADLVGCAIRWASD